jgi:hypothetical protein
MACRLAACDEGMPAESVKGGAVAEWLRANHFSIRTGFQLATAAGPLCRLICFESAPWLPATFTFISRETCCFDLF